MLAARYLVLFLVAAAPLVEASHVKPIPLAIAASLLVLHGLACAVARPSRPSPILDGLSALMLLGCLEVSAIVGTYDLIIAMVPARTPDGHQVMPTGQVEVAFVLGGLIGVALAFSALRPVWRDRLLERLLLNAMGLMLMPIAVWNCFREFGG